MKCAMELLVTATVKAEENKQKQILQEQREREIKRANTIRFCEELGAVLETKAKNGRKPESTFYCSKLSTRPLSPSNRQYADRRTSYFASGDSLDLEVMAEWFSHYCFEVVVKDWNYWSYGYGSCRGYEVTIRPKPICIP